MSVLSIVRGPHPVFKKKAQRVEHFTADFQKWALDFEHTLYATGALGLGAPMVGVSQQVVVINTSQGAASSCVLMVNPVLVEHSAEKHTAEEASLSFPGVSVPIARYAAVTVRYQDATGAEHTLHAEGMRARVIQHEMDYLQGKTPLDHLPSLKRQLVLKKLEKERAHAHAHHVHGPHCKH